MDQRAQEISNEIRATITRAMTDSERSQHSAAKRLGISDLGHCRNYTRMMILDTPYSDEQDNYQAAFNGTAIGDMIEKHLPYETQGEVVVTIPMRDGFTLTLTGHPDILIRDEESQKVKKVWDNKSKAGLDIVRKYGEAKNNRWQVTAYGKALIDAGLADPDDLELALIYVDRSGSDPQPHVVAWQYDEAEWLEIVDWLDDVVEALLNNEDAARDMPRDSFCQQWCPFYTTCWADQTDVEGVLDQEQYVTAVEAYLEGNRLEREGKALKKAAQAELKGVSGMVPTSGGMKSVRWVSIPGGPVSFERQPYMRLSLNKA